MLSTKAPLSAERAGPITDLTVIRASLLATPCLAGFQFSSLSRGDLGQFLFSRVTH